MKSNRIGILRRIVVAFKLIFFGSRCALTDIERDGSIVIDGEVGSNSNKEAESFIQKLRKIWNKIRGRSLIENVKVSISTVASMKTNREFSPIIFTQTVHTAKSFSFDPPLPEPGPQAKHGTGGYSGLHSISGGPWTPVRLLVCQTGPDEYEWLYAVPPECYRVPKDGPENGE